jgi:hypothetical protein
MGSIVKTSGSLEYHVDVEIQSREHYDMLVKWLVRNIPSTERYTPSYKEPNFYNDDAIPTRFYFRSEEYAMAFKLYV